MVNNIGSRGPLLINTSPSLLWAGCPPCFFSRIVPCADREDTKKVEILVFINFDPDLQTLLFVRSIRDSTLRKKANFAAFDSAELMKGGKKAYIDYFCRFIIVLYDQQIPTFFYRTLFNQRYATRQ